MTDRPDIRLKRAYQPAAPGDGARILVERLWPRGLAKAAAALDAWDRDIAPSPGLRKWYGHDPARWEEFRTRYRAELRAHEPEVQRLRDLSRTRPLTLVFATRDPDLSSAAVLREVLLAAPPA
jgi:uncharacterized protein YeaO (DUF488 family)